jgi:integrase
VDSYRRAIASGCVQAFPVPERLSRLRLKNENGKRTHWEPTVEWKKRIGAEQWQELRQWRKKHKWHPHQLRHNAATRLRREFGIEAARVILGHRSAGITEIYAEADMEKGKKIMGEVG